MRPKRKTLTHLQVYLQLIVTVLGSTKAGDRWCRMNRFHLFDKKTNNQQQQNLRRLCEKYNINKDLIETLNFTESCPYYKLALSLVSKIEKSLESYSKFIFYDVGSYKSPPWGMNSRNLYILPGYSMIETDEGEWAPVGKYPIIYGAWANNLFLNAMFDLPLYGLAGIFSSSGDVLLFANINPEEGGEFNGCYYFPNLKIVDAIA